MDQKLPSCVTITQYGKIFFDENKRVCASFDQKGNGHANFASGNPALTLTDLGGCICDDDRDIVEEWLWRKPPHGPRKPFTLRLCGALVLTFRGRHENEVACSNGLKVQCGRPGSTREGTYIDRVEGKHPDGRLKLKLSGKNAMSLLKRQSEASAPGGGRLALVQEKHWRLPAVSTAEALQIAKQRGSGVGGRRARARRPRGLRRFPEGTDLGRVSANNEWISSLSESGKIKHGENLWRTQRIATMADPPPEGGAFEVFGEKKAAFPGPARGF